MAGGGKHSPFSQTQEEEHRGRLLGRLRGRLTIKHTKNIKNTVLEKCYQDDILTENIWFVWSETSYSGDERRCFQCGTNKDRTLKIELLSQWKLEAEFRKDESK